MDPMTEPREDGWEELRREIEALPRTDAGMTGMAPYPNGTYIDRAAVLAIVDRLAATRGEPPEPPEDGLCGECGHDDSEHVHYCSHEEREGSCGCNAEYARLAVTEPVDGPGETP